MAVPKDTRQYVITYMKRKYEWQIKELKKRVRVLEKTVDTLAKVVQNQQTKLKKQA